MQKRIWIAWETQRRSIELSKQLSCDLHIFEESGALRYFRSIKRTLSTLKKEKPEILFVQNPSMVLAFVACIYGVITKTAVVVDRHTTFQLNRKVRMTPRNILFRFFHRYTIRTANLTVVTNRYLADIVDGLGGRSFILQDKLPEIPCTEEITLKAKKNVLLIGSFGKDEPVKEVLMAMSDPLFADVNLYVSGNYKKLDDSVRTIAPSNVSFTGFLEENDFFNLIWAVDAIMVLTTSEYTMLCGCYEAVSTKKPLITSNKNVLEDYFEGAVFVDNTTDGIRDGLKQVLDNVEMHTGKISLLQDRIRQEWSETYQELEHYLLNLPA